MPDAIVEGSGFQTRGCCVYPQGRICIWVAISAAISFIANVNVSAGCYYVKVNNLFPGFDGVYIGYGGVEHLPPTSEYSYCEFWSQSQKDLIWDAAWKTGLSFSILATIFSGGPLVVSLFFSCFAFDVMWTKICAYMMILSSVFTWLSYIGFAAGVCQGGNCTFSIGAGLALIAGLNSFWTALIFFRIQPYQEPEFSTDGVVLPGADLAPGTVQVTEQVLPDGSKKTVRTTVYEDGSRTVEETVVTPVAAPETVNPS